MFWGPIDVLISVATSKSQTKVKQLACIQRERGGEYKDVNQSACAHMWQGKARDSRVVPLLVEWGERESYYLQRIVIILSTCLRHARRRTAHLSATST